MRNKITFMFLIFCLFFVAPLSAQRPVKSGSIQISLPESSSYRVKIEGPLNFNESLPATSNIVIGNIIPGEYTLIITSGRRGATVMHKPVVVNEGQRSVVSISSNQRVSIKQNTDSNSQPIYLQNSGRPIEGNGRPGKYPGGSMHTMNNDEFNQFLSSLKKASFDKDKLNIVSVITTNDIAFTTAQIATVIKNFSYDGEKISCIKLMDKKVIDPQNMYTLGEYLTFNSSKKKYYEYLKTANRL